MSDILIWVLLIFVFLIIIGLYNSEFTPLKLSEKQKILDLNYVTENFTPNVAPVADQLEGSSQLYHWGLPEEKVKRKKEKHEHHEEECHHECQPHICPKPCPQRCPLPNPHPIISSARCENRPAKSKLKDICYNCDITLNKNIDKYVLKSSVPACPDMSDYVTKNMIPANTNLNDYILKSEVKPCEKVDVSQYILKSEIPACPTCPICPECPICPICPEPQRCKEIHEYDISDHPDLSKYIKKDDILNSPIVKELIAKREAIQRAILEEEALSPGQLINNPKVQEYVKSQCTKYCNENNICNSSSITGNSQNIEDIINSGQLINNPKIQEYIKNQCSNYNDGHNSSSRMIEEDKIRHIVEEESKKNDKPMFPMNLDVNGYYAGDSLFAGV
jgi:hypothetical protein